MKIYTIGHSTCLIETFIKMLRPFGVKQVVDIRRFPGSTRYPQFNGQALRVALQDEGIGYQHIEELGGRRRPQKNSKNLAWRVDAFRGYADYMETDTFKAAADKLQQVARQCPTAYMCSEALWWSCHRALVSDYLKWQGWQVWHILKVGSVQEHPYTKPAHILNEQLSYAPRDLFSDGTP